MERKQLICPKCGARLVKKEGKFGKFWGCSNFPECNFTSSIFKGNHFDERKIIEEKYGLYIPKKLWKLLLKQEGEGIVYFIRLKKNGLIKIGSTSSYLKRISSLNNEHDGVVPVLLLKTKYYEAFEKFLHELFKCFLKDGAEYFDIPAEYLIEVPKIKIFLKERVEILRKEKIELAKLLIFKEPLNA